MAPDGLAGRPLVVSSSREAPRLTTRRAEGVDIQSGGVMTDQGPRTRPAGPTRSTALHARHRHLRTVTVMTTGRSPGLGGPRCCRSATRCPTITSRPPIGRAAASQHGHRAGLDEAHEGIASHQDSIPSALATNLSGLRVFSTGRQARRRDGAGIRSIRTEDFTNNIHAFCAISRNKIGVPLVPTDVRSP